MNVLLKHPKIILSTVAFIIIRVLFPNVSKIQFLGSGLEIYDADTMKEIHANSTKEIIDKLQEVLYD
jgi:hypothetical protein